MVVLVLLLCEGEPVTAGQWKETKHRRELTLHKLHNVIVCYADWQQCDSRVLTAAEQGCNVIVWFAINIRLNQSSGAPMVLGGPDPDCVAGVARNLTLAELDTVHLVSVGGWDQQHPDTSRPPVEVWETLKSWNEKVIARPHLGFSGYDGFDWDIEGSDSPSDAANAISVELLEMIGAVSKMAKREGYVVSMAPLESYLDPSTSLFNRSLQQTYPEWENLAPGFKFHGRNSLAYLLVQHGHTTSWEPSHGAIKKKKKKATFDIISIQLYETFSHANYAILHQHEDPSVYLAQTVSRLTQGWVVDFSTDEDERVRELGLQTVRVHGKQLVLGVANAWAGVGDPVRALYLTPLQLKSAYGSLLRLSLPPRSASASALLAGPIQARCVPLPCRLTHRHTHTRRGFMFWSIKFEGTALVNTTIPVYFAVVLNSILKVRPMNANGGGVVPRLSDLIQ